MSDPELPVLEPDDEGKPEPSPRFQPDRGSYSRSRRVRGGPGDRSRLEVGDAIGQTFSIWFGNIIPFSGLALLIYLPYVIATWLFYSRNPDATLEAIGYFEYTVNLADKLFFGILLAGATTYGVVMQLRGQRAPMGRSLTMGLSRLIHVLLVSIVMALIYLVVIFFGVVPAFIHPTLGVVTMIAVVVAIVILYLMLYVAVPTVVVEQVGVFEALGRSRDLTKGYRGTIFGVVFLFGIVVALMAIPIVLVLGMALTDIDPWVFEVLTALVVVLLSPLPAILHSVVYHALRTTKEGVNTEDLAAVFE